MNNRTHETPTISGSIDRSSPIPYYHQLKELIRDEITSDRWPPGFRIPSEPQLCELLDISRTVVRQALGELVNERLLVRRKGLGTFVGEKKISGHLFQSLTGFYDDMLAQGLTPKTEVLSQNVVAASQTVAEILQVAPKSPLLCLERLRSVNGEPIVLVTTYLPYDLCGELEHNDFNNRSLYRALDEVCGLQLSHGHRMIEALRASASDAKHLGIKKGDPLLYLRSVTYLDSGQPIEYYEAKHRGDRSLMEVDLVRTDHDAFVSTKDRETPLRLPHGDIVQ